MRIIEIQANELGGHNNQWTATKIEIPEGWAVIPDSMAIPHTFPFVDIEVEDGGVTAMTAGTFPPPEPTPEPTPEPEPEGSVWDELAEAIRSGVNEV